jgi:hypothetical protein
VQVLRDHGSIVGVSIQLAMGPSKAGYPGAVWFPGRLDRAGSGSCQDICVYSLVIERLYHAVHQQYSWSVAVKCVSVAAGRVNFETPLVTQFKESSSTRPTPDHSIHLSDPLLAALVSSLQLLAPVHKRLSSNRTG